MISELLHNKGLMILVAIILCIIYFSPDVECVMLMTGIMVNIISLCINTGTLKITPDNKSIDSRTKHEGYVNMRAIDSDHLKPSFDDLNQGEDVLLDKKYNQTLPEPKLPKIQPYKGAIDWSDNDEIYQDGNSRIASESIFRQGVNNKRAWSGAYNLKKNISKYWQEELYAEEMEKPWWAKYDA